MDAVQVRSSVICTYLEFSAYRSGNVFLGKNVLGRYVRCSTALKIEPLPAIAPQVFGEVGKPPRSRYGARAAAALRSRAPCASDLLLRASAVVSLPRTTRNRCARARLGVACAVDRTEFFCRCLSGQPGSTAPAGAVALSWQARGAPAGASTRRIRHRGFAIGDFIHPSAFCTTRHRSPHRRMADRRIALAIGDLCREPRALASSMAASAMIPFRREIAARVTWVAEVAREIPRLAAEHRRPGRCRAVDVRARLRQPAARSHCGRPNVNLRHRPRGRGEMVEVLSRRFQRRQDGLAQRALLVRGATLAAARDISGASPLASFLAPDAWPFIAQRNPLSPQAGREHTGFADGQVHEISPPALASVPGAVPSAGRTCCRKASKKAITPPTSSPRRHILAFMSPNDGCCSPLRGRNRLLWECDA